MEFDPFKDNWIETDAESIDNIVDSENITLMNLLIYKLLRERDQAYNKGYQEAWQVRTELRNAS